MAGAPPITFGNFTGINFNQIIQTEVAAASVPITNLNNQIGAENTQISSLGAISANVSLLQSAVANLNTDATTPQQAVNVQAGAPFTASSTGSPASGVYNVTVSALATSQISASQGFASSASTLGTGTVTLTVGGVAHQITVDTTNNTLSGLAGAINTANLGVTAQVVNTGLPGAPYRLELSSNSTGAANAFSVSSSLSGGASPDFSANEIGPVSLDSVTGTAAPTISGTYSGKLSQGYRFTVTSGGTVGSTPLTISYVSDSGETGTIDVSANYATGSPLAVVDGVTLSLNAGILNTGDQFSVAAFAPAIASAANAQVQAGNQIVSSASNSVTNAIPGVTLNLSSTGGPTTVTVSQNVNSLTADVNTFVNAYNGLLTGTNSFVQAVPGQPAPALASNGGLETLLSSLGSSLGTVNLSTLGITIDSKSGQLIFNSTTFATNVASNPTGVNSALSAINTALSPTITSTLAPSTGLIASDTTTIQNEITQQNAQITSLQTQVTNEQNALTTQYALLQAQIAQYQSVELYLNTQSSSGSSSNSSTSSSPIGSNLTVNG
ncbi:MAG TPA: flagellar filament capping protein FliD [Candidatus Binataceae bacterium]|nr:flagellar filament capping protein FliD [Candidatus Binataceae bacterium]